MANFHTAEEGEYRLWRDKGATSNLNATYYKKKQKVENLKSGAKQCLDIRNFFQVQDEDEDSDDTIDEMEMNFFIPRMEMLPEVPNQYSQEDAFEKLLPLVMEERWRSKCGEAARWMVRHCDRWHSHSYSTENAKCKWCSSDCSQF